MFLTSTWFLFLLSHLFLPDGFAFEPRNVCKDTNSLSAYCPLMRTMWPNKFSVLYRLASRHVTHVIVLPEIPCSFTDCMFLWILTSFSLCLGLDSHRTFINIDVSIRQSRIMKLNFNYWNYNFLKLNIAATRLY